MTRDKDASETRPPFHSFGRDAVAPLPVCQLPGAGGGRNGKESFMTYSPTGHAGVHPPVRHNGKGSDRF
jgi:hypothetical protein